MPVFAFVAYQLWGTGLITAREQSVGEERVVEYFEEVRTEARSASGQERPAGTNYGTFEIPVDDQGKVIEEDLPDLNFGEDWLPSEAPSRGKPLAIITFPTLATRTETVSRKIGLADLDDKVSYVIYEGEDLGTLRKGSAYYTNTPLPGEPGNAAIAGHRTTHGAPFSRLDSLEEGDLIIVETATGIHTYVDRNPNIAQPNRDFVSVREGGGWGVVRPSDVWVVGTKEGAWLMLTTCHPKRSASQRLIVFAELVASIPYDAPQGDV
jgi:hypothetical protein